LYEVLEIDEATIGRLQGDLLTKAKTEFKYLTGILQDVNVFVFPIMDEVESSMGMLFVFSKLDSKIDLEEEIRASADRYNSEYRIAKIFHEVKNPLGIMLNHLQLIRTEQSVERIRDNALSIEKEVERISRLLEQLKKKEDSGKPGRGVRTKTSGIVREIAELLEPVMKKSSIRLNVKYEYDSIMLHDPDLIRQVMLNIVLNGIEAMKAGGELKIVCKKLEGKEVIVIEVSDTGIGIPKRDLERIFEPFYTTKQDRNSSGMGLSISREIVHSLDGYITVESIPTQGSTFRVFLPANGKRNQPTLRACP
jgi:polar amino acid transport system substrate-binding protein